MAKVKDNEEAYKKLMSNFGPPREGFEEFFKKCEPVTPYEPSSAPNLCKYYRIPDDGEILHHLMIQPYHDSRTMLARPTDILVVSWPKTGTTWTQEITYLVAHDCDVAKAKSAPTEVRFPYIEIPINGIKGFETVENPRLIKSHLPYDLLPKSFLDQNTKMIYIVRNPKDTIVSFFHFLNLLGYVAYSGTLKKFVENFCKDLMMYSSFGKNVLSFWNRRHQDNILFLFYEDLSKDMKTGIRKIADFLGKQLTEEQVDIVYGHCTFDSMTKNPMANYSNEGAVIKNPNGKTDFLRKGKVGDWKNHFDDEMSKMVDDYVEKWFKGTGIEFQYEI
ncbi:hypothetical protein CHUAL_008749 [Chamberlinius hualienensis]